MVKLKGTINLLSDYSEGFTSCQIAYTEQSVEDFLKSQYCLLSICYVVKGKEVLTQSS